MMPFLYYTSFPINQSFLLQVDKEKMMLLSEKERKVTIHNTSVLVARSEDKVQSTVSRAKKLNSTISAIPLDWLVYEELSRLYYSVQIRSVAVLSSVAVALVGGSCLSYDHSCLRLKSSRKRKGRWIFGGLWICGRVVRALSLGSKGPEFDPSMRLSVVKIANHC